MLALALRVHEDSLCKGCGVPMDESMDPANERHYHTDLPVRCHACTAYERAREKVAEAKYPQPGALRLRLALEPHQGADQGHHDPDQ